MCAWDNRTINDSGATAGSNDYLQVGPGETKRVRVLLFENQEPATYGVYKVEVKQPDGTDTVLSFTSFPGCKLENNRDNAKFGFRNILNVWDYSTSSVKKLAFGTRLKDQIKALHFNSGHIGNYDINISRIGEKRDTQWFAAPVMNSAQGLPPEFNPTMITWDIYNLTEFAVVSEEEIARQLAEVGINYDEFTKPKIYTLEEAMAFKLPFSKHKGKTLGEVFAIDTGWITWAANNARMTDLRNMCQTIQHQLIAGGSVTPPTFSQVAPANPAAQVTPPVQTVPPQQVAQVASPAAPVNTAPTAPVAPALTQTAPAAPVVTAPQQAAQTAAPVAQTASPSASEQTATQQAPEQTTPATREGIIAAIDEAIRKNPEFKNYQRVVEVMREVTAPTPNFDLRQYTDVQLNALLVKVQA